MSVRKKVLLVYHTLHPDGERILAQEVDIVRPKEPTPEAIKQAMRGVHAIVAHGPIRIGRDVLETSTDLEVLSATGSGADCFDIAAATDMGLPILNSPGVAPIPVAEHTIGMMIALTKRIVESDTFLRRGDGNGWQPRDRFKGVELEGKTVGIVGLGHIGSLVARKCHAAFSMRVLAYDPVLTAEQARERGAEQVSSLADLFQRSDVITVHVPLLPNTRGLIGAEEMAHLRPTAFFINASRGGVVDQQALYRCLVEKRIAGAALDVFDPEPPRKDEPLFKLPNVVVTPHSAGVTEESTYRLSVNVAKNLLAALRGERPPSIVNPSAWPPRRQKAKAGSRS
ncbi:MAG: hydroxyacid dehydrogenase [Chloroflexi bacterium]|nr:hydroxyacid dehydrogenase [Chloroflexota bacterium]